MLRLVVITPDGTGAKSVTDILEQDTTKVKLIRRAKRQIAALHRNTPSDCVPTVTFQVYQVDQHAAEDQSGPEPFHTVEWPVNTHYRG